MDSGARKKAADWVKAGCSAERPFTVRGGSNLKNKPGLDAPPLGVKNDQNGPYRFGGMSVRMRERRTAGGVGGKERAVTPTKSAGLRDHRAQPWERSGRGGLDGAWFFMCQDRTEAWGWSRRGGGGKHGSR